MISQIDISKEVEACRKYLILANFKKSTVKMYCRTIEKFLKKTKAEVDPTEQLHQSHSQTYLLERLEQNKAWYHQISNGYSNTLLYPKSELHPTIYRHGEILQTLSMIEMQ